VANHRISVLTPAAQSASFEGSNSKIQVYAVQYAPQRLQSLAHEPGGLPAAFRKHPLRIIYLPVMAASMLLAAIIRARKADLIHGHWSLGGLIAGLAGWATGIPSVATLWGSDVNLARQFAPVRWLLLACIRTNRRVIAVNPFMADQLKADYPRWADKFVTISNGVGEEFFHVCRRLPESFTLVVIGNLTKNKGVGLVLRAFQYLLKTNGSARLTMVGDGPERASLERLAGELGVSRRVRFLGRVDPQTVPEILAESSAMVLASSGEGRPNVVLEAMAAGVPVIASDIDGVRGLIEHKHTGLLFSLDHVEQLSRRMKLLADRPDLARTLAANARRLIETEGFTWQRCADRHRQLYDEVLQEWHAS
jgi:glycosyltransferase involved in cell wall biosynthesis